MLSLNVLRRLRPCFSPGTLRSFHTTGGRLVAPCVVFSSAAGLGRRPVHAFSACSMLSINSKLQSQQPSIRLLCTTTTDSEDGNLIYRGNLATAVRVVKMFCYTTTGGTLCIVPFVIQESGLGMGFQNLAVQVMFCGILGFFTFINPVLLHFLTKGYVARLYHNRDKDTYTAITYSIFLTEKRNTFHQRDVKVPSVSKMFTSFYAGTKGLLINPDNFSIPEDYNHLMGYDKPFTFDPEDMDMPNTS